MSCPDCRPNGRARLLWLGVGVTVLLAIAYVEGAFDHRAVPDTGTAQENPR
ncbi:MAG TPA: hypothetical protein VFU02_23925 [Polyangiaceae bacterium]|nr:hypothetical protein [Polyangiaceae bacterium]